MSGAGRPREAATALRGQGPIALVNISGCRSGTEQVMLEVAVRLVRDGTRTIVVLPATEPFDSFESELTAFGVQVKRYGDPFSIARRKVHALTDYQRIFRAMKPSIVHFHVPWAPTGGEAIMGARLAGVRSIVRTEHNPITTPLPRLQRAKMLALDRLVARVVFVSEGNKLSHVRHGRGSVNDRARVIPNGLAPAVIDGTKDSRSRTRATLGLRSDSIVAAFVGTLEIRKGPEDFVAIAANVLSREPRAEFVVIGDGPEKCSLEHLVRESGLTGRLHLLGKRSDVRELLPAFDIFVQPSHYEGLSIAMLEALAAGLPMVTTDVGGVQDVFPNREGAVVCDIGDIAAMAAGVSRLCGDAELRACMGSAGRARVEKCFSAERMYDGYKRLYRELLQK